DSVPPEDTHRRRPAGPTGQDHRPARTARTQILTVPGFRGTINRGGDAMATFVLIPGAGGEAWYWHLVVPEIEARGHEAVAVDLPAGDDDAGWNEYAAAIDGAIGDRSELVLVAQSLGGFSAPIVCDRRSVDLLVLLNAMIPAPGETGEAWWSTTKQSAAQAAYLAS